ncbi:MAG: formylglycine-generating enzyme family protein [Myxococcales bacterium]|nr:formylglycine-generating enzyme family protein [Myxococcales bacterium]
MRRRAASLALLALGCSGEAPAPLGEAIVEVDTNLPVPSIAQRLRIDLYAADGGWFESRDLALPDPRDWPLSFSVYNPSDDRATAVWIRLRVYPEGGVRTYAGERFSDWGSSLAEAEGDGLPRLAIDGRDQTPSDEPQPLLSVDRLLLVELTPGRRGRLGVLLDGACAGTMAKLSEGAPRPVLGEAESCVAEAGRRDPVRPERPRASEPLAKSQLGTFAQEPCPAPRPGSTTACIPGAAIVLGTQDLFLAPELAPTPERLIALRRFWLDRNEISVSRYRAAIDSGFEPPVPPNTREGELGGKIAENCTFSDSPIGREEYALSCIDWRSARALCQFLGGDLPTEAQWEHAASRGNTRGSRYPWGNNAPTCTNAVFGRAPLSGFPGVCEVEAGFGPRELSEGPGDVSPDGVHGLAGGLAEWCLDAYQPYAAECWGRSPNLDPGCFIEGAKTRSVRGGSWAAPTPLMRSQARVGAPAQNRVAFIGVRCAYATEPAP